MLDDKRLEVKQGDTSITIPPDVQYSGFWRRVGAYFFDGLIALPVLFFISYIFISLFSSDAPDAYDGMVPGAYLAMEILVFILSITYFAVFESSKWQATPGKRVMKIKVVDKNGQKISFGRAIGRYFGKFLSELTLGIGYLMVAFTERGQSLHDKVAGTYVVRTVRKFNEYKD